LKERAKVVISNQRKIPRIAILFMELGVLFMKEERSQEDV